MEAQAAEGPWPCLQGLLDAWKAAFPPELFPKNAVTTGPQAGGLHAWQEKELVYPPLFSLLLFLVSLSNPAVLLGTISPGLPHPLPSLPPCQFILTGSLINFAH